MRNSSSGYFPVFAARPQARSLGRFVLTDYNYHPDNAAFMYPVDTLQVSNTIAPRTALTMGNSIGGSCKFRVNARKLTIGVVALATDITITIDGVLTQTITRADSTWQDVVIMDNVSDAIHDIQIDGSDSFFMDNSSGATYFLIARSAAGTAVIYPPNFSNPLQYPFDNSHVEKSYLTSDGTASRQPGKNASAGSWWWRVNAQATGTVQIYSLTQFYCRLFRDGVQIARIQTTAAAGWQDFGVSLSDSANHDYWVMSYGGGFIGAISINGVNTTALAAKERWNSFGDSIIGGAGIPSGDTGDTYMAVFSPVKQVANAITGIGGSGIVAQYANIITAVTANTPAVVLINHGHNDDATVPAYANAIYDCLHGVLAVSSVQRVYYLGVVNYGSDSATRPLKNSVIQSVCTGGATAHGTLTAGEIAKVTYINSDGFLDPADTIDGVHPNVAGHLTIAYGLLRVLGYPGQPVPATPVITLGSYSATTVSINMPTQSGPSGTIDTLWKVYKDGVLVSSSASSPYTFTGLTTGVSYAFTAKANNAAGDSAISNTITQTPQNPTLPTLSDPTKQLALFDFDNNSYTDASATVPATIGDLIRTVKMPSGWDLLSPGGYASQATSGNRPTLRSDGAQPNGTSTVMTLPANIVLSGDFTIVTVDSRDTTGRVVVPIGYTANATDIVLWSDGNLYFQTPTSHTLNDGLTGLQIRYFWRSGSTISVKSNSGATQTFTDSSTLTFDELLRYSGSTLSATESRFRQIWVMNASFPVTGSDGLAIIAYIRALLTGVLGP